jgi:hypothetical protein
MNQKGFGRYRSWCNQGIILELAWKENHENSSQDSPCLSGDLNQAPPEYKDRALLLDHRVRPLQLLLFG